MKYRIKKETKPKLSTFGKYKAVAVHERTISSDQIFEEAAEGRPWSAGDIEGIMLSVSQIVNKHLRNGDRVRLNDWGMMKLEIESDKVDSPNDFKTKKHIRGVRLHFLPESNDGTQPLYNDIDFEKDKTFVEE